VEVRKQEWVLKAFRALEPLFIDFTKDAFCDIQNADENSVSFVHLKHRFLDLV
jgi:hypothetical protein